MCISGHDALTSSNVQKCYTIKILNKIFVRFFFFYISLVNRNDLDALSVKITFKFRYGVTRVFSEQFISTITIQQLLADVYNQLIINDCFSFFFVFALLDAASSVDDLPGGTILFSFRTVTFKIHTFCCRLFKQVLHHRLGIFVLLCPHVTR